MQAFSLHVANLTSTFIIWDTLRYVDSVSGYTAHKIV